MANDSAEYEDYSELTEEELILEIYGDVKNIRSLERPARRQAAETSRGKLLSLLSSSDGSETMRKIWKQDLATVEAVLAKR